MDLPNSVSQYDSMKKGPRVFRVTPLGPCCSALITPLPASLFFKIDLTTALECKERKETIILKRTALDRSCSQGLE